MSIKELVTIVGKDGISNVVNINNAMKIAVKSGDKISLSKGENGIIEDIVAIRKDAGLVLTFSNGDTLALTDFYSSYEH